MILPSEKKLPLGFKRPDGLEYTHYRYGAGFEISEHAHEDAFEAYFFLDGRAQYLVEGVRYELSPGDILLVCNRLVHRAQPDPAFPYERIVISVGLDFLRRHYACGEEAGLCFERAERQRFHAIKLNAGESSAAVYQCLARIENEIVAPGELSEQLVDALILQLLVLLNRAYSDGVHDASGISVCSNEVTDRVIRYLNEHLTEDLTLERLSKEFFLSKYHLSREFKRYTGYTLHNFILKKRLLMARALLQEQDNLLDVSVQCGFGDYSSFVRSFKREYGVTPYQFAHPFQTARAHGVRRSGDQEG